MRYGMGYPEADEVLKRAYVDAAEEDFKLPGKSMSAIRISILTGINRVELTRLRERSEAIKRGLESWSFLNRATAVVNGWVHSKQYQDKDGHPIDINLNGKVPSFDGLVKQFSGGMTTNAVLDELISANTVRQLDNGKIRLLKTVYCPAETSEENVTMLGSMTSHLIGTIGHNMLGKDLRVQLELDRDRVPESVAAELKDRATTELNEMLVRLDNWVIDKSREYHKRQEAQSGIKGSSKKPALRRVGVGVYFFDETKE